MLAPAERVVDNGESGALGCRGVPLPFIEGLPQVVESNTPQ